MGLARDRGCLFEVEQHVAVGVGLVVLALHALAVLRAQHALLETLAVFLDAERLAARAPLALAGFDLDALGSGGSALVLGPLAALLVAAVDAPAQLVALLSRRKALAVQLHALGVATVAEKLLLGTLVPVVWVHPIGDLNLKYILGNMSSGQPLPPATNCPLQGRLNALCLN